MSPQSYERQRVSRSIFAKPQYRRVATSQYDAPTMLSSRMNSRSSGFFPSAMRLNSATAATEIGTVRGSTFKRVLPTNVIDPVLGGYLPTRQRTFPADAAVLHL